MSNIQVRNLQLLELNILKEVKDICDKNNLKYYLLGGTLLGSVRHKGFIPWDDDIDICMPREDYEKFLEIAPIQLKKSYKLSNYKNNKDYILYFSKVTNSLIKLKSKEKKYEEIVPAWIDIFPLDGMPNNILIRKIHQFNFFIKKTMLTLSNFNEININTINTSILKKIFFWLEKYIEFSKFINSKRQLDKIDILLKKYPYENSKYVCNFMGAYKFKEMFSKKLYDDSSTYIFEDIEVVAPRDYDFYLTQLYGDYMKLPPENERNRHLTEILN